jgi:hypothetical protein
MSHSENSAPSPRRIRQASAPQNEILSEEERADLVCLADFPSGKSAHQAGTVLLPRIFWETDWNTGLIYFRARWYNPETGRWLSKDEILSNVVDEKLRSVSI